MYNYFSFHPETPQEETRRVYDFYVALNKLLDIKEYDNWLTFKLRCDGNWAHYKTERYFKPAALRRLGKL